MNTDSILNASPTEPEIPALFSSCDPKEVKRLSRRIRFAGWVLGLCGIGLLVLTVSYRIIGLTTGLDMPFVYFEIKNVTKSGNPIAGAEVSINEKVLGRTDSFGEWRHYLQLQRGEGLRLELKKQIGAKLHQTSRNLVVPISVDGREITFKKTIEFNDYEQDSAAPVAPAKAISIQNAPVEAAAAVDLSKVRIMTDSSGDVGHKSKLTTWAAWIQKALASEGVKLSPGQETAWVLRLKSLKSSGSAENFVEIRSEVMSGGEKMEYALLRPLGDANAQSVEKVLKTLRSYLPQTAMVLTDSDKIVAAFDKNLPRFVLPQSEDVFMNQIDQVVRVKDIRAEGTFIVVEADKTQEPCKHENTKCQWRRPRSLELSPKPGAELLTLNLSSDQSESDRVYVGGYRAERQSPGQFRYWGEPGKMANLSIVRGSTVLRSKIMNARPHGSVAETTTRPMQLARKQQ